MKKAIPHHLSRRRLTVVPCCLKYRDALLDGHARVAGIIRRVDAGQECDVHAKRLVRELASLSDSVPEGVGAWLRQGSEDS